MPRPPPPSIPILPTARWRGPDAYWSEPWSAAEQGVALDKYRAISAALLEAGAERTQRLRGIAGRWPGALREAQITAPPSYERRAAAVATPDAAERSRASWADAGLAAIPLWCDLHGLLGDVACMRRAGPEPFSALPPARRRCWPDEPAAWPAWVLRRLEPRVATAWLAALAGLDPAQLELALRR